MAGEGPALDSDDDRAWMEIALAEARAAGEIGEVPIGAVIVHLGEIVARAHNRREIDQDPLAHAEILAIRQAAVRLGCWRLTGATLYVTLERWLFFKKAKKQSLDFAKQATAALAKDQIQQAVDVARKFPASHLARVTRAGLIEFQLDVDADKVIVAPDCGMKYLPRGAAFGKMRAMAEAAKILRREFR